MKLTHAIAVVALTASLVGCLSSTQPPTQRSNPPQLLDKHPPATVPPNGSMLPGHQEPPHSQLAVLIEKANVAETIRDRLEHQTPALKALLAADVIEMKTACDQLAKDGGLYNDFAQMLWRRLAQRKPDTAIACMETITGPWQHQEVAGWVWSEIAKTDPERAYLAVERIYDPKSQFFRLTLHSPGLLQCLVYQIMIEVGTTWFRQERLAALSRLNSLNHRDDTLTAAFNGFCNAATNADERLALLDRMVTDDGIEISMWRKSTEAWWETMCRLAAEEDREKTRTWLEGCYPPGTDRASHESPHWYRTTFRHVLFRAWSTTQPIHAADWLMAQHGASDPDGQQSLSTPFWTLWHSEVAGPDVALNWIGKFSDHAAFTQVVLAIIDELGSKKWNHQDLMRVTKWLATMPLSVRARVLAAQQSWSQLYTTSPFELAEDDPIVAQIFPVAAERQKVLAQVAAAPQIEPASKEAKELPTWGNEFRFDQQTSHALPKPAHCQEAKRLASLYEKAMTAIDPEMRLAGFEALEWLSNASPNRLRKILRAHLQNCRGEWDDFTEELIYAWVLRDWKGCETFAWTVRQSEDTRRALLIETFCRAAESYPDQVYARIMKLVAEERLWSKTLDNDGARQGDRTRYYAFMIPHYLGRGWIKQDGQGCVAKMRQMPSPWIPKAIEGASEAVDDPRAAVALLDWIGAEDRNKLRTQPDSDETCSGLTLEGWNQAREAFRRLASLDPMAARAWIEAWPNGTKASSDYFDAVFYVYKSWFSRDPLEASRWYYELRKEQGGLVLK